MVLPGQPPEDFFQCHLRCPADIHAEVGGKVLLSYHLDTAALLDCFEYPPDRLIPEEEKDRDVPSRELVEDFEPRGGAFGTAPFALSGTGVPFFGAFWISVAFLGAPGREPELDEHNQVDFDGLAVLHRRGPPFPLLHCLDRRF